MSRDRPLTSDDVAALMRSLGPVPAGDLARLLDLDPATLTRLLAERGTEAVAFGATKTTIYGLRREIPGLGASLKIHRISLRGKPRPWAFLEIFHGAYRIRWADEPPEWAGRFSSEDGLWRKLPWFLEELRPRGFLANHAIPPDEFPPDPVCWSDDQLLRYLAAASDDLPGDIVVGDECLERAGAPLPAKEIIATHEVMTRYPVLADAMVHGLPSRGLLYGNKPKFLANLATSGDEAQPVVVKFSPPVRQDTGRRWGDLLVMEFHALSILSQRGFVRLGHRLIDAGGRRFLESPRFDRTPSGGRIGTVSLETVHDAVIGTGAGDWVTRMGELHAAGWVPDSALHTVRRLQVFGELIGNTDMRADNLLLWFDHRLPLPLAPVYDMLPMLWAPGPEGELGSPDFEPEPPASENIKAWREMFPLAEDFWDRVTSDQRVSREFIATARAARETLVRLR